jgi:hypothetical protein
MNLVAVEERFGSWMTQYAYANYTTSEKLMELGSVTENGFIKVGDMKYNTLVALFEPLPAEGLLKMIPLINWFLLKVITVGCLKLMVLIIDPARIHSKQLFFHRTTKIVPAFL